VAADEAGTEVQEVPLRAGSLEDLERVDAHAVEDDGELVHERDVEVALRVLDDLGRFGHLDGARAVDARLHDGAVNFGQQVGRGLVGAGNDLRDGFELVHLVAGVDALRRVAHGEVRAVFEAAVLLHDRHADFFGQPRVDRGLVADDNALGHVGAHGVARAHDGSEIRRVVAVDGRGNGHDDDGAVFQDCRIRGKADFGRLEPVFGHFPRVIVSRFEFLDAPLGDIEADHVKVVGESDGEGQAHITEADDGQGLAACGKRFKIYHLGFPLRIPSSVPLKGCYV